MWCFQVEQKHPNNDHVLSQENQYISIFLLITLIFIHSVCRKSLSTNSSLCVLQNRGYSCFQAEPTTKVFVTWFAPVIWIFTSTSTRIRKLLRSFTENVENTLALPSRWRIIDNRNNLYYNIVWQSVTRPRNGHGTGAYNSGHCSYFKSINDDTPLTETHVANYK